MIVVYIVLIYVLCGDFFVCATLQFKSLQLHKIDKFIQNTLHMSRAQNLLQLHRYRVDFKYVWIHFLSNE